MNEGKLLSANTHDTYVVKLVGDVRVPLCKTIDECVETICAEPFKHLTIDFSDAENADSTTLGLMAKLCIRAKALCGVMPVIFTPHADMTRLLNSMGFENISVLSSYQPIDVASLSPIECESECCDDETAKNHVLEAHRTLMTLCEGNETQFSDLVEHLEAEL